MSDVKVQQKQSLSRQEAARLIAALAEGLGEDGGVTVQLGNSTLELSVTDQVDWELEVEVDGDEIELELELKWSRSRRAAEGTDDGAEGHDAEDVDSEEGQSGDEEAGEVESDLMSEESDAQDSGSGRDALAEEEAQERGNDEDAAGVSEAESVREAEPIPAAGARSGRRSASAGPDKSPSNGVDTAAVRAWAAANGLTVSPRGRIKDEVLQAYRDAGN